MTMDEYERRFLDFLKYFDFIKDDQVKIQRFLSRMPSMFSQKIQYDDPNKFDEVIRRVKCLYDQHIEIPTFQKAWEDNKKGKMKKRKKGKKTPFLINNSQGQLAPNEPRITETLGKIQRHDPIKCWVYEGCWS
jgi:hypothetical protein